MYKANPDQIVEFARSWLGTRWRHQARGPHAIDCAGMLVVTMKHFDLPCEDLKGYGRQPGPQFTRQIRTYTDSLRPMKPIHGAIGVFNDSIMPCHTGIFAVDSKGRVTVIHADAFARRVIEEDYDESSISLRDRLTDIRLFKEVDYGQ